MVKSIQFYQSPLWQLHTACFVLKTVQTWNMVNVRDWYDIKQGKKIPNLSDTWLKWSLMFPLYLLFIMKICIFGSTGLVL